MESEKTSINSIIFGVVLSIFVIFMCLTFTPRKLNVNTLYQVYLGGEKIGLIKNENDLYDLIDSEQKEIKEKYNVDKVHSPSGLEIRKVNTYKNNIMTIQELYDEIKDLDPFTIEGYEVKIAQDDGNIKSIYILNKEDLDKAIKKTILAFVPEEQYDSYLNGTNKNTGEEGKEITDIYLNNEVSIKKTYISVEEEIITNEDDLSQYFLFGTTELQDTYKVKATDTIESIAEKNKLGVSDFLIANPDIGGENALLAVGQEVSVAPIAPVSNIVVESFETELQTVKYETKVEYDKTLNASTTYVKQQGCNGLNKVTFATRELNGSIISTAQVSNEVITDVVDKIVVMGAKNVVYYGNTTYWAWPTSKPFRISEYYGWRIHPIRHTSQFHSAIDITGVNNKNIYAVQSGVVTKAVKSGYNSGQGKYVYIDHKNGYASKYLHLSKVNVKEGETVEKGQVIGIMGCTGSCTGTHLHFSVTKNGNSINPFSLYK